MITKVKAVYLESGEEGSVHNARIPFTIDAYSVTVLNDGFRTYMNFNGNGQEFQYWSIMNQPRVRRNEVIERLRGDKNAGAWTIR